MTHPGKPRRPKPPFAPRGGKQWVRHDDAMLGKLVGGGMHDDEIARVLGRSVSAVRTRRWGYGFDLVPRHRGEAVINAVTDRATRDAWQADADARGESLAYFVGRALAEMRAAQWAGLRARLVGAGEG